MNKKLSKLRKICLSALLLLPNVAVYGFLPDAVDDKTLPSLAPMLDEVTPTVVNIATEGKVQISLNPLFSDPFFRRFFNAPDQAIERKTQSLGSGVIVDAKRGLILTNNHVIANALQITVTLRDGRQLDAELVGTDPATDVAVIKITEPQQDIVAMKIADSDQLRVGDFVVAIGNPFGLSQTVTSGIVSALGRSGLGIEDYEDFIQTDASINPGNSGGALVNLRGELVGINTAIFSKSGGNIGLNFAIPINLAMQIAEQLLKTGKVQRGFFGITTQDLDPTLSGAFGLKNNQGVVVTSVLKDSPEDKAGLQQGDILLMINGKTIKNSSDLLNRLGLLVVGEQVTFDILHDNQKRQITMTVTAAEQQREALDLVNRYLAGVTLSEIGTDQRYYGRVEGVNVVNVQRNSVAWRGGLRAGDIITSVNHHPVNNVKTFLKLVTPGDAPLLLRILRGNTAAFIFIK